MLCWESTGLSFLGGLRFAKQGEKRQFGGRRARLLAPGVDLDLFHPAGIPRAPWHQ